MGQCMDIKDKKRQHYVWQYYLGAWIKKDNKVAVLYHKDKVFVAPTNSILYKDYFYSIEGLTENDVALIEKILVTDCAIPIERKMLNEWFAIPVAKFQANEYLKILKVRYPQEDFTELETELKWQSKTTLEEFHCKIENNGREIIDALRNLRLDVLNCEVFHNELYEFLFYLATQYSRTTFIKNKLVNQTTNGIFDDPEASVNFMVVLLSNMLANRLIVGILEKQLDCYILYNSTETEFITSDQPVINLLYKDELGYIPQKMQLYYPLNRYLALLITDEKPDTCNCNVEMVDFYNSKIAENSTDFIIASDRKFLLKYKV